MSYKCAICSFKSDNIRKFKESRNCGIFIGIQILEKITGIKVSEVDKICVVGVVLGKVVTKSCHKKASIY